MIQPNNPTTKERHSMLREVLRSENRIYDFGNIISALNPPPNITKIANAGDFKNIKIGIIGAGLAGLSSAVELRKLGYDITIFEATDRIGGRVYTHYFDSTNNMYGELGAMRIPVSHETTWHYINKFNLPTRPFIQSNKDGLIYVKNLRTRNTKENIMKYIYPLFDLTPDEKITPYSHFAFKAFGKKLLSIPPKNRVELLLSLQKYYEKILFYDALNIRQSYEIENISQGAIDMIQSISPLERSLFYHNLIEPLNEEYSAAFSVLYEINGGLHRLPEKLYNALKTYDKSFYGNISKDSLGNVKLLFNSRVNGIYYDNKKGIISYFDKHSTLNHQKFDFIICAIPFSSLRNINLCPIFSNIKMQSIREVEYPNLQKTAIYCNYRFWESNIPYGGIIGGGSSTDLPISTIWYPSDHSKCINVPIKPTYEFLFSSPLDTWVLKKDCSPYEKGVLIGSYNGTLDSTRLGNLTPTLRDYNIKRQLEEVHGLPYKYLDNIVIDMKTITWNTEDPYLGGVAYYYPEQKRLFSYGMTLPEYNNKLFFAGEHISSVHGWMQGALQTGMLAANSIASQSNKIYKQ